MWISCSLIILIGIDTASASNILVVAVFEILNLYESMQFHLCRTRMGMIASMIFADVLYAVCSEGREQEAHHAPAATRNGAPNGPQNKNC